jgi:hypothetical protein
MTTILYVQCFAMFFLGQAASLFGVKIPSLKKQAKLGNAQFIWKDWWASDWNLVIFTNIVGVMVLIGLSEFLKWKPGAIDYIRWLFAAVGAFGNTVVLAKFSQYGKYLDSVIDVKTNIADGVTPPTDLKVKP